MLSFSELQESNQPLWRKVVYKEHMSCQMTPKGCKDFIKINYYWNVYHELKDLLIKWNKIIDVIIWVLNQWILYILNQIPIDGLKVIS